jgi:hypothetical protein
VAFVDQSLESRCHSACVRLYAAVPACGSYDWRFREGSAGRGSVRCAGRGCVSATENGIDWGPIAASASYYVVTPNGMHLAKVHEGATVGKRVLCEKPMANSSAEGEAMIKACPDANVLLTALSTNLITVRRSGLHARGLSTR